MSATTKILLLGVGRWGANHLRVLHSLPIELYVTDLNPNSLEGARKLGIPESRLSTNYQDFAGLVDAAVVVTPAQSHFPLCKQFLEAGKDVFVEKPITLVSDEAKALADLAKANKRMLQVGHIFRFDSASKWIYSAIQTGELGKIRHLRSNFSGFKRPRNDSGIVFADAIHFIDLYQYYLGVLPNRVSAVLKDFLGRGMEDSCVISLEYDLPGGTAWGIVETNYFLPGKFRELTIVGSEVTVACDFNVAQYKIKTFANKHVVAGKDFKAEEGTMRQVECPPEEPLLAELRAFLDSIHTRKEPLANGQAGYESIKVIEAVMLSARTGQTVAL